MFGRKQTKATRPADLPPDLDPRNRNIMDTLEALARAIAQLREEVRKR